MRILLSDEGRAVGVGVGRRDERRTEGEAR